jgi:hypothetical protein
VDIFWPVAQEAGMTTQAAASMAIHEKRKWISLNFAPGVFQQLQEKPDDHDEFASTHARRFVETGP